MEQPRDVKHCPQCGAELERGHAMQFFSMLPVDEAYLCRACKIIYAHDLKEIAKLV